MAGDQPISRPAGTGYSAEYADGSTDGRSRAAVVRIAQSPGTTGQLGITFHPDGHDPGPKPARL